jgi:hypothetical protein
VCHTWLEVFTHWGKVHIVLSNEIPPHPSLELVIFLVAKFHHFAKIKMERKIYDKVLEKITQKRGGKIQKLSTT